MIPALVERRALRLGAFAGLYFAQGIPWGLFLVALPTWLAAEGHSSGEVGGFIAAVSLPWTLKLFTGPVMDRFAYLPMGRRRPWVLLAQTGILTGTILLAIGPAEFGWLLAMGFLINFCAAWQDVAVDGMAIDVLPVAERARANAFMFGGQAVGIATTSAAGAWLLGQFGLAATAAVMATAVAMIALIPLSLRERPGERLLPWTDGDALPRSLALAEVRWARILGDLVKVLLLPMSVLLVTIKFGDRVAVGLASAAFPVVTTQDLGYDETFYPRWSAVSGLVAAGFGVLIAPLIDRIGARRALAAGLALKAAFVAVAALAFNAWSEPAVMAGVILSIGLLGQLLTVATIALFMGLCTPRVAATQFAVYMALSNLALSAGSALLGILDRVLDFAMIFGFIALIDLAMLGLLAFFRPEQHRARLAELYPETDEDQRLAS